MMNVDCLKNRSAFLEKEIRKLDAYFECSLCLVLSAMWRLKVLHFLLAYPPLGLNRRNDSISLLHYHEIAIQNTQKSLQLLLSLH
eukprot:IDg8040t1